MCENEVMSTMKSCFDLSVLEELENECYLKPDLNINCRNEIKTKIEEFSNWLNGTARPFLLRCPDETETFIYLLLNLKKKLKYAISEINRSASNTEKSLTCSICEEVIQIQPWQNAWTVLQSHPHFEETYYQLVDTDDVENMEISTTESVLDDLSEEFTNLDLPDVEPIEPEHEPIRNNLNDFRFNFTVKNEYDSRVIEALYPDSFTSAARKRDHMLTEYTIQKCGVGRGVCLLCPCNLLSKGRVAKVNSWVVKNHVWGQKHLRCAQNAANQSALSHYHDFWKGQIPNYQAHQVYFMPEVGEPATVKCQLCLIVVPYCGVIKHIQENTHKSKVVKIFNSIEGKLNEFYLMDMQVGVYEGVSNTVKEKKISESKSNVKNGPSTPSNNVKVASSALKRECLFVKVVKEPTNGIVIPPRFQEHAQFLTAESFFITCKVCERRFLNTARLVILHITSPLHKASSKINVPKYKFFCEICNIHFKDEGIFEDHLARGSNRHDNLAPSRKEKVAEYECRVCNVVIFGDGLSLIRHKSSGTGKTGKAKEIKLPMAVRKLFNSTQFIEEESRRLYDEALSVLAVQDKMKECCDDLELVVQVSYPNCRAYPFGSRISGLGNHQSDLDVFLDLGDMYVGGRHQDPQSQEQFVKNVSKNLKAAKEDFSSIVSIASARTPIVKLIHIYTKLKCDVSFRHGLGVENTKLLRFCFELQPITQPFVLLLKKWSEYCRLNEHISNYGLAMMAVFFLQTGGFLLSVKTIRQYNPTQSLAIDGWDTLNYTVPIDQMRGFVNLYTGGVKQLLRDFFSYFANFDYSNNVVCPLLGTPIPKLLFNEKPSENLPPEMSSYIQRIESEDGEQFRGLTPFCVQDPFDLSHNLTKACPHGTITKLKTLCALTCEFLDNLDKVPNCDV